MIDSNIAILKFFISVSLDKSVQITFILDPKYQLAFVNVRPLFLVRRWYRPWRFWDFLRRLQRQAQTQLYPRMSQGRIAGLFAQKTIKCF